MSVTVCVKSIFSPRPLACVGAPEPGGRTGAVLAPAPEPDAIPERPRRILIADDEHLAGAAMTQAVSRLGYTPIGPARDGEHAVEMSFSARPDMALLDVHMAHESDGIETAAAMFGELLIPVIIVSAFSDQRQAQAAAKAGVFGYLVKPATIEQLRPAIEVGWARFQEHVRTKMHARELQRCLDDRRMVDRAKWMLVETRGVSEIDAARQIRLAAKADGKTPGQVAREIVGAGATGGAGGYGKAGGE